MYSMLMRACFQWFFHRRVNSTANPSSAANRRNVREIVDASETSSMSLSEPRKSASVECLELHRWLSSLKRYYRPRLDLIRSPFLAVVSPPPPSHHVSVRIYQSKNCLIQNSFVSESTPRSTTSCSTSSSSSSATSAFGSMRKVKSANGSSRANASDTSDPLNTFEIFTVTNEGSAVDTESNKNSSVSRRHLLYIHGGGFVAGDFAGYHNFCTQLSEILDCDIHFVQYRLCPENQLAHSLSDVIQAYESLWANADVEEVIVMGDSAGGCLCLLLLQHLVDRFDDKDLSNSSNENSVHDSRCKMPLCAILMSPAADLACSGSTFESNASIDCMLSPKMCRWAFQLAVDSIDPTHPSVSPLYGSFKNIPPLMLLVAVNEILYDDTMRVASAARLAGVKVELDEVWAFHAYPLFWQFIPEGRAAIQRIRKFIDDRYS
jgi:monoterpene epsilon-lactone hydrolase